MPYLKDTDIIAWARVGKTTYSIVEFAQDVVIARRLAKQLALLTEHTGANTLAEQKEQDVAEDCEYFYRHVATDGFEPVRTRRAVGSCNHGTLATFSRHYQALGPRVG